MTVESDMLLLTADSVPEALSPYLRNGKVVKVEDPYEALIEMGRRRWSAILLSFSVPDFAGLCRASRRLQPDSAIFGLCTPALEPEIRLLTPGTLTDYFICPPSKEDVEKLFRTAISTPSFEEIAALTPQFLSRLLSATHSVSSLEDHLCKLVTEETGVDAVWSDAEDIPPDRVPMLLTARERPRVLHTAEPMNSLPSEDTRKFLQALQELLPELFAVAERTEALHRLAITDPLTGAYNRRYFYHLTDKILRHVEEKHLRAALLLYDIDNFKQYNDAYGYACGDEILRDTAALMKQITRKHDIVARIGGDEFAVLFWDPYQPRRSDSRPPEDALILADRFLNSVSRHQFPSLGPKAKGTLTISGGLARFPQDGRSCRELLRSADRALKQAKRSGKNAVHLVGA